MTHKERIYQSIEIINYIISDGGHNINEAIKEFNISYKTIHRRINKLGLYILDNECCSDILKTKYIIAKRLIDNSNNKRAQRGSKLYKYIIVEKHSYKEASVEFDISFSEIDKSLCTIYEILGYKK